MLSVVTGCGAGCENSTYVPRGSNVKSNDTVPVLFSVSNFGGVRTSADASRVASSFFEWDLRGVGFRPYRREVVSENLLFCMFLVEEPALGRV